MDTSSSHLFLQDLVGLHAGRAQCEPGHSWGPGLRDHYKIHLVLGGQGTYHVGKQSFALVRGQGFLIVPHVVIHYHADAKEPWEYAWVGFRGTAAAHWLHGAGLSQDRPVFAFDPEGAIPTAMQAIVDSRTAGAHDLAVAGSLAQFLAALLEELGPRRRTFSRPSAWTRAVIAYIEENAGRDLSVEAIANHIGLQRSYLGSVFRRETGLSIQGYLIRHRIRSACLLLEHSELPVNVIARSVGYADALLFSKTFRRQMGCAPREFRTQAKTSSAPSPLRTDPSPVSLY